MIKPVLITLATMIASAGAYALDTTQQKQVQNVIQLFKKNDVAAITKQVQYPLKRDYPIPDIKNPADLQKRFDQIFDAPLKKQIAQSQLKDWSEVGSEGVMLSQGEIWLDEGKIIAVNHSGKKEQEYLQQIIQKQKNTLHSSVKNFTQPIVDFKTSKYRIRVDELANGQLRYASWGVNQAISEQPQLVLKGKLVSDGGSFGDANYVFKNGQYTYTVNRNTIGESDADILFMVEKNDVVVIDSEGTLVY